MAWHFDVEVYLEMLGLAFVVFFGEVGLDVEAEIVAIEYKSMEPEFFEDVEAASSSSTPSGNDRETLIVGILVFTGPHCRVVSKDPASSTKELCHCLWCNLRGNQP